MLGRRTFAQAMGFFCVFWLIGEIFLGYNRTLMADTFTGNVYLYTQHNGSRQLTPINAKIKVDVIDSGYINDRVNGISESGLRIKFTGDTTVLKQYGIDPGLMKEESQGGLCQIKHSNSRTQEPLFFAGMKTENKAWRTHYASAHHLTFIKTLDDDADCKSIHLGILNSSSIQIVFDKLSGQGMFFADLKRDSHIPFLQRMVMSLRSNPEGEQARFLVKN
ncbi:hypothetical protein D3C77_25030 [compost metagenome]